MRAALETGREPRSEAPGLTLSVRLALVPRPARSQARLVSVAGVPLRALGVVALAVVAFAGDVSTIVEAVVRAGIALVETLVRAAVAAWFGAAIVVRFVAQAAASVMWTMARAAAAAVVGVVHAGQIIVVGLMWAVPLAALLTFGLLAIGPRTGAYRTLTVLTGSMRPGIPPGSVVVVAPEPAVMLKPGDIITYNAPLEDHRVVTHRVVWTRQHNGHVIVQTKGDANNTVDPWIAELSSSTVWKVRFSVPYLGRGISALRSPSAKRLGMTALPASLAVVWLSEIWWEEAATMLRRRRRDPEPAGA